MENQWFSRIEPELEADGSYRLVPLSDEFAAYERFVAHSDTVSLHVAVDSDGARCHAIEVRGERLTSDDLRLPLIRMLRQAVAGAALPIYKPATDVQRFATVAGQKPRDRDFYRQFVAGADRPRRGKRVTDEQLLQVRDVYRAAVKNGDPPKQTIAAVMHASPPTAARWVAKARERGFLEPALRGKAGERARDSVGGES